MRVTMRNMVLILAKSKADCLRLRQNTHLMMLHSHMMAWAHPHHPWQFPRPLVVQMPCSSPRGEEEEKEDEMDDKMRMRRHLLVSCLVRSRQWGGVVNLLLLLSPLTG